MPSLSRNQWRFTLVAAVLTCCFFLFLYRFIDAEKWGSIPWLAGGYGVAMFVAGLAFGATDPVGRSRSDLGLGYHAITFVVVTLLGTLATLYFQQPLLPYLAGVGGWLVGLAVHYMWSRKTIKGIEPDEAFP